MRTTLKSPDVETAVRMYYEKSELTNSDLKELLGLKSNSAICRIKKNIQQKMAEQDVKSWLPHSVNTKVAYEVIGIDIDDYERRLNKLRKLRLVETAGT